MVSRIKFLWHTAALVSISMALTSPKAAAQTPGSSPSVDGPTRPAAPGIPAYALQIPGKKVMVRTLDGSVHHGIFAVSDIGLVGSSRNAAVSVPFDQVVTVRNVTHRTRYGALIGLAAGIALGAVVPAPANCGQTNCQGGAFMALYGGIGAGIGAALGGAVTAASGDLDLLYDARPGTKSLTIAPILSPSRKGAAFKIAWR